VGIKNLPWNYLLLPGNHASYFDHLSKGNGLIITPIWDPAVEWCPGTPYEVLVVAVQASTYMWMGLDPKDMDEKKWLAEASDVDLHKATDFLKLMVKVLADQLVGNEGGAFFEKANGMHQDELELLFANQSSNTPQTLEGSGSGSSRGKPLQQNSQRSSSGGGKPTKKVEEFKNKLNDLQKVRETLRKAKTVAVPKLKNADADGTNNTIRVLKVDFAVYFSDKLESLPDPFLLALKAAISWSSLQETKLLPASSCTPVTEDESVTEDQSVSEDESAHLISSIKEIICNLPYDDDNCSVLSEEKPSVSAAVVVSQTLQLRIKGTSVDGDNGEAGATSLYLIT
jgi:hypothetical protein